MAAVRLVVVALFVASRMLTPAVARAEDVATILAALPVGDAEDRYMMELCTRVARLTFEQTQAIDRKITCVRAECPTFRDRDDTINNLVAARQIVVNDFLRAAAVYRAKRGADFPACEPATDQGMERLTKRLAVLLGEIEATEARINARPLGARRADCERACQDLAAGDGCVANCAARYQ